MSGENDKKSASRDIVCFIFVADFLLGIGISIYSLSNMPWSLLGSGLALSIVGIYVFLIVNAICFLAIIYWVADDGGDIWELDRIIMELRQRVTELESKQ